MHHNNWVSHIYTWRVCSFGRNSITTIYVERKKTIYLKYLQQFNNFKVVYQVVVSGGRSGKSVSDPFIKEYFKIIMCFKIAATNFDSQTRKNTNASLNHGCVW